MIKKIPRIMIAGTSSGSGKTTIICGLLKALINRRINVVSYKCGPDYIDPMFHRKVIGINSSNLDLFFNDENTVKYLLMKNYGSSDIALIEGVMGYYDGIAGKTLKASSYDLARVTETPVVLVINCKGKSTSIIAEIKGFLEYRKDSGIKGVILNNMSSMLYPDIKELIEGELSIEVLGYVPTSSEFSIESRHLGLVTADEIKGLDEKLEKLATSLEETINIQRLIEISKASSDIECMDMKVPKLSNVKIAVAKDSAFCFYYQDNLELLMEMGAEIVEFSPLKDTSLPKGISGLIIGGGYPEIYAKELSKNKELLNEINQSLENGLPCIAECGGFMYLSSSIEDVNGESHEMVGYFNTKSFKTDKLSRFGYITLTASRDNIICRSGESINAHEFHYWDSEHNGDTFNAKKPERKRSWDCINYKHNTIAGYPHLHFYSNISFPQMFLQNCIKASYQQG